MEHPAVFKQLVKSEQRNQMFPQNQGASPVDPVTIEDPFLTVLPSSVPQREDGPSQSCHEMLFTRSGFMWQPSAAERRGNTGERTLQEQQSSLEKTLSLCSPHPAHTAAGYTSTLQENQCSAVAPSPKPLETKPVLTRNTRPASSQSVHSHTSRTVCKSANMQGFTLPGALGLDGDMCSTDISLRDSIYKCVRALTSAPSITFRGNWNANSD
ncbi:unnamed protein product [Pleuronectes platessa]|uniref:Uncharacterized protein n=1 Tax=Pleuronectes platessa TaxID=8262 RepID=A0A9N7Y5W9_PLEPL|nr:unnamed protein product [Pleuronectes platessa]